VRTERFAAAVTCHVSPSNPRAAHVGRARCLIHAEAHAPELRTDGSSAPPRLPVRWHPSMLARPTWAVTPRGRVSARKGIIIARDLPSKPPATPVGRMNCLIRDPRRGARWRYRADASSCRRSRLPLVGHRNRRRPTWAVRGASDRRSTPRRALALRADASPSPPRLRVRCHPSMLPGPTWATCAAFMRAPRRRACAGASCRRELLAPAFARPLASFDDAAAHVGRGP
jgi:hypothetical protein